MPHKLPTATTTSVPVKTKHEARPAPRYRWNRIQKAAYVLAFTGVLVGWTIPWILAGFVGLLAFIIPGLVMWVVGAWPIGMMIAWYRYDDPWMQKVK